MCCPPYFVLLQCDLLTYQLFASYCVCIVQMSS